MNQNKKLYVVGIEPGEYEQMTMKAVRVLESSQLIVGYTVYINLIRPHFPDKEVMVTSMMREVEHCRIALQETDKGRTVSMVYSGDSGAYDMAGLILELAKRYPEVEMEMVLGVTAACGDAAVLGASICHDFIVISLSDLLIPVEAIERRLERVAQADVVICIYNPSSRKRADYLRRVCDIVLKYQCPETVCGIVRNIGRDGESPRVMTPEELRDLQADMFTTVYIGNSPTRAEHGKMIMPRGHEHI